MDEYVFVHFWITCFQGRGYSLNKDYYLVRDGKVYLIRPQDKVLIYPSGDTLLEIHTSCTKLCKFKAEDIEQYKSHSRDISFKRLLNFVNGPRGKHI